jgi:ATP/maltotriose-dependent transcriptional regulator MalT
MSGPDVLLATKLHVPHPQPGFVRRRRLLQALGEGLARGRVLVCAPAGFGKTALLADWARGGGRLVAWLSLDRGDSATLRRWLAAPPGLIEPLTDRELEVLRLIAAGRSNQRIARDLVVALDTDREALPPGIEAGGISWILRRRW